MAFIFNIAAICAINTYRVNEDKRINKSTFQTWKHSQVSKLSTLQNVK